MAMRFGSGALALVFLVMAGCSDSAQERMQSEKLRDPQPEKPLEETRAPDSGGLLEEPRSVDLERELEAARIAAIEEDRKRRLELQRTGGGEMVVERYELGDDQTANLHPSFDGQKKSEGYRLDNGKEVGFWAFWYSNGQKWKEGRYENGEQEGVWVYWYPHGPKWKEETYKSGMVIGMARYENGKIVE